MQFRFELAGLCDILNTFIEGEGSLSFVGSRLLVLEIGIFPRMVHVVIFYEQIDPTLIENARIVFLQIFNQRRSGLPTDILLPLDHFETNTIRTITQDMFG